MSAAAEETKNDGASGGGGGGKLVLILTAVNLLLTVGVVAVLLMSFGKDQKKPRVEDINAKGEAARAPAAEGGEKKEGAEVKSAGGGEGKEKERKPADLTRMVTLEQFTVNLATPGGSAPKFVRVNVSLEVGNEDTESEVNAKVPQVRNVIIDLFNSKRAFDLATAEGRDYLKEEIRNALNGFLVHGKVRGVYFTNFALAG